MSTEQAQTSNGDEVSQQHTLTPVANHNRIEFMDVLRGFALIGIILMNIEWFNRPFVDIGRFDYQLTGIDWSAGWLVRVFVEGKFYKLFSLLFGMGFAVMLLQAKRKEQPFYAWFSRRMVILFAIGMLHMVLLWGGDILHDYAVGGLILLFWVWLSQYKWMQWANKDKSFLTVGLGLLALPFVVSFCAAIFFGVTRGEAQMNESHQLEQAVEQRVELIKQDTTLAQPLIDIAIKERDGTLEREDVDEDALTEPQLIKYKSERRFISRHKRELDRQEESQVLKHGSYWQSVEFRAKESVEDLAKMPIMAGIISFPLFLIGYWFVSSGAVVRPQEHLGLFKGMAWVGLGLGSALSAGSLIILAHPTVRFVDEFEISASFIFMLSQYLMSAGYVGVFVLMMLSERAKRLIMWLAPIGKMALTNYLMQTVILSLIFFGYGFGLYGEVSRFEQVCIAFAVILLQVLLSKVWLKYYRFGPMEWLWRSLTYKQKQPFKLQNDNETKYTKTSLT